MGTEEPPLLGDVARLRELVDGPLLISHAFRTPDDDRGRAGRRGGPRRHGARADRRSRHAAQAARRPRGGDPAVRRLQRGLPRVRPGPAVLGQPGARTPGRGAPAGRAAGRAPRRAPNGGRVAIVGAGPAGLECALDAGRPPGRRAVRRARGDRRPARRRGRRAQPPRVARAAGLLRARARGGRAPAGIAPVRADDLAGFDEVVLAIGSTEALPELPGIERALPSSAAIGRAPERAQPAGGRRRVRLVAVRERRRARRRAPASRRSRWRRRPRPSAARCRRRVACSCSRACAALRSTCARSPRSTSLGENSAVLTEHDVRRRRARAGRHGDRGRRARRARLERAGSRTPAPCA